jgi:uncharacterized protein YndB with AHSA1/START domain
MAMTGTGSITEGAGLSDRASVHIEAPAERIYDIVTDIAQMGRLSPECTGGSWLGRAGGPKVGARFRGWNRRGIAIWFTTNTVVTADPGRGFAFETKQSGMRWRYEFEPDERGTVVTESREPFKERPRVARVFSKLMLGGVEEHDDELREGIVATLHRLKEVAEAPATA